MKRMMNAPIVRWMLVLPLMFPSALNAQEPLDVWSLQEELRIGSVDGGPYALVSLGALTVSPRTGAIFVALGPDEIRAFSAEGDYLRSISRAGEGPGELSGVRGFGWVGELLVVLNTTRRGSSASTFTEEGDLGEASTPERAGPADFPAVTGGGPAGVLSGGRSLWQFGNDWFRVEPGTRNAAPVYLMEADGSARRLDLLDGPRTWRTEQMTGRQPLSPTSYSAVDAAGRSIVITHQNQNADTFRVRRLAADGTVLYARSYGYSPVAVPGAYADSIIDAQIDRMSTGFGVSDLRRVLQRTIEAPEHFPPITGLAVGIDGSVWLKREATPGGEATWWVLDPSGDPVGHVRLPSTTRILHADQQYVWLSERGALDVPYLVRTRIQR